MQGNVGKKIRTLKALRRRLEITYIVNAANCLLNCISKAETDMKHVTGEQWQRVLNPVLEQGNEILRRIACLRLPPVYPRLLDAGPGVGVSSAESRIRILEKARVYGNERS